ncbi:MAG TPA: DUF6036 family nucleotidyltransferase [Planctomycetota bacterium]|nr:DUF6036 family nucleotidyltransferase [Planctomycetota bacterium]
MRRSDLEHILRAASAITLRNEFVFIGSQAILAEHPDAPIELVRSIKLDIYPRGAPSEGDLIDGAIGEGSVFHNKFGYYAHGVGPETATLPNGWEERLVPISGPGCGGATAWCLETHDVAIAKLVAGREKDLDFVRGLVEHDYARPEILRDRLEATPLDAETRALCEARLQRIAG